MYRTWRIVGRRYVTVVFESQEDVYRWESVFKLLVEADVNADVIGDLCTEAYGGPAWLYHPPGGKIELYVPHIITEFICCEEHYHWALDDNQQPVRRYDGTAQQVEEAVAAEPVR